MPCVIEYNGTVERAVKLVKVIDGHDACTVAFVPRVMTNLKKVQDHLNKFVQVSELYDKSKNTYKRSKSQANYGMALVELLVEDTVDE